MSQSSYEPKPLAAATRLSCYPWLVVGVACTGAFLGQLDASIIQLALPALEHAFHAPLGAVSWVALAYSLAFAATLPMFARLSEMFGRKLFYLAGYAGFSIATCLCGACSHLGLLILLRVIQGTSGALLGANSLTILVKSAGPHRRGRAMGIFAAAQAVGVSCGPVAGGLLLASLGWRSLFYVTVPFGVLGVVMGWLLLPQTTETQDKRFDAWGAVLLTPALTAIILVLSELQAWGPKSVALWSAAAVAIVFLPLFVWHERRAVAPLIDLQLFRAPAFTGGVIAVTLSYALLYSMFLLMSFAFVRGFHASPVSAGLHLAIVPVVLGLIAPFSGSLYERHGARIPTTLGMAICATAAIVTQFSLMSERVNEALVMGGLALFGAGLGLFIAPNNSATMASAPDNRTGEAGGLVNLVRVSGTAIGIAAASTALSWRLKVLTGLPERTVGVAAHHLLAAVSDALWMLVVFAIIAGVAAFFRGSPRAQPKSVPGFKPSLADTAAAGVSVPAK
jgi:EmrB/QacA subfamily drug resistance transporter